MEIVYYTVTAVLLYAVSDWLLNRIEIKRGKRFEHRTLIFFAMILTLALVTFEIIQRLTGTT